MPTLDEMDADQRAEQQTRLDRLAVLELALTTPGGGLPALKETVLLLIKTLGISRLP